VQKNLKISYLYLNLHLFSVIKIFVVILFCINTVLLVSGFWHFLAVIIPFLIFLGYVIIHIGTIKIKDSEQQKMIQIRNVFQTIHLESPVKFSSWWCYSFNEGFNPYGSLTSGRARTTSNDYFVLLHLADNAGEQVLFKEKIELDSRFPNETNYSAQVIPPECKVIKVQRVDKVYDLIRSNLATDEFTPALNGAVTSTEKPDSPTPLKN
jgi:hypothetical protein